VLQRLPGFVALGLRLHEPIPGILKIRVDPIGVVADLPVGITPLRGLGMPLLVGFPDRVDPLDPLRRMCGPLSRPLWRSAIRIRVVPVVGVVERLVLALSSCLNALLSILPLLLARSPPAICDRASATTVFYAVGEPSRIPCKPASPNANVNRALLW
jgi:hypothetical protein